MTKPIKASKVEKVDAEVTDEQLDRKRARRAVESRLTRRQVLKKAGVKNVGSASADDIEASLEQRVRTHTTRFRAQKAVAKRRKKS